MFILSTMQHVHSLNCKISRRKYSNFYFFNGLNTFRLFERIFLTWKPLIREEENVRKAFSPKGARHTLCSFLIKVACTCIESGYFRCGTSRGFLYAARPFNIARTRIAYRSSFLPVHCFVKTSRPMIPNNC